MKTVSKRGYLKQPDYNSITLSYKAGEAIAKHKILQLDADDKVYLADKSSSLLVIGVALNSAVLDDVVEVLIIGQIEISGLELGTQYYVGNNGDYVQEGSIDTADNKWKIFFANGTDKAFVRPEKVDPIQGSQKYKVGDMYPSLRPNPDPEEVRANGQCILVAKYGTLTNRIYVGDSLNATADYGYRCDNADGTGRNTTGIYLKLPDQSGIGIVGEGSQTIDGVTYSATESRFQADQGQGHYHEPLGGGNLLKAFSSATTGGAAASGTGSASTGSPITDGTNGTPRTGTYTRGPANAVYWYIKALEVTGSGEPVIAPVPVYDSGWVANSDWTAANIVADYNSIDGLSGLSLPDFDIEFLFSVTGADSDSQNLNGVTTNTASTGYEINQSGVDEITVVTGANGLSAYNSSGGGLTYTTQSAYYRIIIKPKIWTQTAILQNNAGYNEEANIDLTSSGTVVDLSSLYSRADGYIFSVFWKNGDGTYEATFTNSEASKTIGGVDTSLLLPDIKGQGQGRLTVRKDGNNLRILEYFDTDGGSFTGEFKKDSIGEINQSLEYILATGGSVSTGTLERSSNSTGVLDYPLPMVAHNASTAYLIDDNGASWLGTAGGTYDRLSQWNALYVLDSGTIPSENQVIAFTTKGRWTQYYPEVESVVIKDGQSFSTTIEGNIALSPVPRYDSGWVANSVWGNAGSPTIDYSSVAGLSGLELPDLNITFLRSTDGTDSGAVDPDNTALTSTSGGIDFGYQYEQAGIDHIKINFGSNGQVVFDATGNNGLTADWYRVIITPKVWTDTAILQNNGGYNNENTYDLSSGNGTVDLTNFFNQVDGYIESWTWRNGDGTYNIRFDSGDYIGKTIGKASANLVTVDLQGDGFGRLTLRKDGNNARVLCFEDNDGGNFSGTFSKDANGVQRTSQLEIKDNGVSGPQTYNHVLPYKLLTSHMLTQQASDGVSATNVQMDVDPNGDYSAYLSTFDAYVVSLNTGSSVNLSRNFVAKFEGKWTQQAINTDFVQSSGQSFLQTNNVIDLDQATTIVSSAVPYADSGYTIAAPALATPVSFDYATAVPELASYDIEDLDIHMYWSADAAGTTPYLLNLNYSNRQTGTSSYNRGLSTYQASAGNVTVVLGSSTSDLFDNAGQAFSIASTGFLRITVKPKVWNDLAILQNNGGYNVEHTHDLSASNLVVNLEGFFTSIDGFIESWEWSGGDGTYEVTFTGGDLTGKTIGGVDAETLKVDLKGQGQGRLTLRKDGNNARILSYSDVDGGGFTEWRWKKTLTNELTQEIEHGTLVSTTTAAAGFYRSPSALTFTYPISFVELPYVTPAPRYNSGSIVWQLSGINDVASTQMYLASVANTTTGYCGISAKGRWTTLHPKVG